MPPTRPPSRRRALHERSPSETNEPCPSPSLRLVYNMDGSDNDIQNIYTSSPYPTKPEQILLPIPGKGQELVPAPLVGSAEPSSHSSSNLLSDPSQALDSSFMDQSIGDPCDVSSTVDARNTPSQSWEGDPHSSRTSFPELGAEATSDRKSNGDSEGSVYSDDGMFVVPETAPTIKAITSELPTAGPPSPVDATSLDSSPNVVPIGAPSSPNFVALDNSSMNVVRIGPSSNPDSARSNSLASMNSYGTVVRNYNAAHWIHTSSPGHSISHSPSFRSSPPYQSAASSHSASTRPTRDRSHSRSGTLSSRSGAPSDIQAIIDSGVSIQYPTIRAPSSSSSWVDTPQSTFPEASFQDLTPAPSRDRFHSHLSTVPSQVSGEYDGRVLPPVDESFDHSHGELSRPSAAMVRQKHPSSSARLASDSKMDDSLPNLAKLPARPVNPGIPSSSSSESRQSSLRSNRRPGTSSSIFANAVPAWARVYYRCDERMVNSAISLIDGSRPPSARPPTPHAHANILNCIPTINQPAIRAREIRQGPRRDPTDPRTHWVDGPEPREASPLSTRNLTTSWSPHLYPDRTVIQTADTTWTAPSLDSVAEPMFGRRNIQVYLFCLGFICPPSEFLVASSLALPDLFSSLAGRIVFALASKTGAGCRRIGARAGIRTPNAVVRLFAKAL